MKKLRYTFWTMIFLLFANQIVFGQNKKLNRNLMHIIDSLHKADQDCAAIKPADSAAAKYQRVIRLNFLLVKSILDTFGFPGYNLIGKESSDQYFLLVQHSDFDVEFQKRALKLMKIQVKKKNASGSGYAFLVDRTEINSGNPQIYGTQIQMSKHGTKILNCIDTINLDKRRKSVGLSPLKDYLKKCDEIFKKMNPTEMKKED